MRGQGEAGHCGAHVHQLLGVDEGELVPDGSHDGFLACRGIYKDMFREDKRERPRRKCEPAGEAGGNEDLKNSAMVVVVVVVVVCEAHKLNN